mgnify:CR=1 FL=1
MLQRTQRHPSDRSDERIGLTEAFSPVGDAQAPVDGSDERIGLTEAFSPVGDGAHAGGFSYRGDNDDEYPDAIEALEPVDAPPLLFGDDTVAAEPEEPQGRHGKQKKEKKQKQQIPAYQRKSRRMRRVLIAIVVLLVLLIGALGYFAWQWFEESQLIASQQTQEQQTPRRSVHADRRDEGRHHRHRQEDRRARPGRRARHDEGRGHHGAQARRHRDHLEGGEREGNPVKTNVTVALTDEPADTRSGTPTVYLGLNEDGCVVQAGYSAATASLGYGSLSFVDAVKNEGIIEKTLQEAGVNVPAGSAQLPADKTEYSEYASDGTTLVKESYSFSGTVDLNGAAHEWSALLLYNYSTANTSGNLADTIRIVYVYVNA